MTGKFDIDESRKKDRRERIYIDDKFLFAFISDLVGRIRVRCMYVCLYRVFHHFEYFLEVSSIAFADTKKYIYKKKKLFSQNEDGNY